MKITQKSIEKKVNGYIGTIIEKRYSQPNLLNNCEKKDNIIKVEAMQDQGPTIFTISEFCNAYKNKNLIVI